MDAYEQSRKLEPPPRHVDPKIARAIKGQHKMAMLLGLIFTPMGIGMGVLFWFFMVPPWLANLDDTGATAVATIESKWENRKTHYNNFHPWVITYRFTDESGATRTGETQTTDREFVRTRRVGDTVWVSYDSSDPVLSKIRGVAVAGLPAWVLIFPGAMFAVGAAMLILRHLRVSRALEVYEQGTETPGTLVSAKLLKSVNMGWKHPMSIKYKFEDDLGQECFGKVWSWHKKAQEFKEGRACTVLYGRAEPARSILYDALALYLE